MAIIDSPYDENAKILAKQKSYSAEDPEKKATDKVESERKKKIVEDALNFFKVAVTAEHEQRLRELEDLKFDRALPEDQWPAGILSDRKGTIGADGQVVGARPCLVIPKLDQPVQQVINEARNSRIGVTIKPKGGQANVETAEVINGLYRTIQQNSGASVVRIGALERSAKCGRGFYRILKQYANDGDLDLDIVIARILNQGSVFLDPFAQEPDWSDGTRAIITNDLPWDDYKRRYPDSDVANFTDDEFGATLNRPPDWVSGETEQSRVIRVAEFYYVEITKRSRFFIPGVGYKWQEELEKEVGPDFASALPPETKSRDVEIRNVKWCVVNCYEVLEEEDWEGRYIPIIPVIGKEYNIDGERCFKGIVSNSKDAQRSYNYMRSAQVEAVGLAPKAPFIMAEGQDEGYEAMWDQLNTKNYTRLKYKPIDFNGTALPAPQRNVAEPAIQAISMAVNMADNDIKATTGRFDPSLGRARADQSGKAINLLKEAGENTTGNYLENLTSISMRYEAKVVLDLLPYVYDRPGRIIHCLGEEPNKDKQVMINQPMVPGPNGTPQAAPPPGMLQQLGGMVGRAVGMQQQAPQMYDLRKGDWAVEISVGKSYDTQRDQNADMIRTVIEAAPALTPLLADLLIENMDSPIAKRAAARLRKTNPALKDEDENQAPIPPQVKAEMDALKEQHQQLTQALEQTTDELKTQKFKVDADSQLKQFEAASRERVAQMEADLQWRAAQLKSTTDLQIAQLKMRADIQEQELENQNRTELAKYEAAEAERERVEKFGHERDIKGADRELKARQHSDQLIAKDISERRSVAQKNDSETRNLIQKDTQDRRSIAQKNDSETRDLIQRDTNERRTLASERAESEAGRRHELGVNAADAGHESAEAEAEREHAAKLAKEQAKQKPKEK